MTHYTTQEAAIEAARPRAEQLIADLEEVFGVKP